MTCPLCSKEFSSADLEEHLLTCMTKPRVRYNGESGNIVCVCVMLIYRGGSGYIEEGKERGGGGGERERERESVGGSDTH